MDTERILKALCMAKGNSGAEAEAAAVGAELLAPYGKVRRDNLGNVICEIAPKKNGRHVLLDAHIDQIALIVTHIDENGFVFAMNCGGIDRRSIWGTRVTVLGKEGEYDGVICSVPKELQGDGKQENPKPEEFAADIGFDKETAEKLVKPGDRVMLRGTWQSMENGYVTAPALDDRAGCACILEALELLRGKELPCGLTAVFSTREETGGEGAAAAAAAIAPTEALEMDVSFGKTPDTNEVETKFMKKGPMIGFAPGLDRKMSEQLVALAQKHQIPWQYEVMNGTTGTNADDMAKAGEGIRCCTVSIPQQYMHTVIEKMAVADIQNTGKLIAAYVMEGGAE